MARNISDDILFDISDTLDKVHNELEDLEFRVLSADPDNNVAETYAGRVCGLEVMVEVLADLVKVQIMEG